MGRNQDVYLVSVVRTAVGKAPRGRLRNVRPETLGATAVRAALERAGEIEPDLVDDVLMGCAMPEGSQGLNIGRVVAQAAGLPDSVPGATVNRFCSSGLQTIAMAAQAIEAGHADLIVAGGVESMSRVPMAGYYYQPDPALATTMPELYMSMGNTAEVVAGRFDISRQDQDAFALESHKRALEAIRTGKFEDEIVPLDMDSGASFDTDEGPRPDSTLEALASLKPVFKMGGSVTAGNSSQLSDGAAAAVVMSGKRMQELGIEPVARLAGFAVAGVAPEVMGIGPVEAVPKVLSQTGLDLSQIDLVELNEAFASQALAVIRELGLDPSLVNVNGGAIALGHPLGCTGAKLTATLLHELQRRNARYGLCTMCIGGGMGAAGIFENLA